MDERSPELDKLIEILTARITLNGQPVSVKVNEGAIEQIFDAYAAVKIRRMAEYPQFENVKDQLLGFADLTQAGLV